MLLLLFFFTQIACTEQFMHCIGLQWAGVCHSFVPYRLVHKFANGRINSTENERKKTDRRNICNAVKSERTKHIQNVCCIYTKAHLPLFPEKCPKFIQIRLIVNVIAFKLCNRICCCGPCPKKIRASNFEIGLPFAFH